MTNTQTLEGAVALLEAWTTPINWEDGSSYVEGKLIEGKLHLYDATVAFLALPVSPDLPASRFDPDVARSKGQSDYEQGFEHGLRARLAAEEAQ